MSGLDLLLGLVSLTLCSCATMLYEEVGNMETSTQLYVSAAPSNESKCGKPTEIKNAFLLGNWDKETYPEGHTANYSCHLGYIVNRRRIKTVCWKGKWTMQYNEPCRKRPCGNPGEIPFGKFELINGTEFVFGAVVEYSCDLGYQIVSKQKTRTCAADGWTNQPPHCEARLCPPVMDDSVIVQSSVTDDEFSMGHVITLKCKNPKQRLKGPSRLHCTADGTWNTDPPTCKESCTIQKNEMRKNHIQLKDNRERFQDKEDVQFECVSGYNISDPAKLTIQCNGGMLRYPTCHKIESCTIQENDMRNNSIQLKHNRRHFEDNEDVQFECVSGYSISDPAKLTIQCNGGMLRYPTCHKIGDLDQQRQIARKHLPRVGQAHHSTRGSSAKTSCGSPPSTLHGEIRTPMRDCYPSGSTVEYQCPYLYKLKGYKKIRCRGGIWEDPPLCLEPCTTSAANMTKNHITLLWGHRTKLCVRNDQRKKHAKKCYVQHDNTIIFACQSGYQISDVKDLESKCDKGNLSYPRCFRSY